MQRLRPKSAKQSTKMQLQDSSSLYSKQHEQPIQQKRQSLNKRAISNKEKLLSSQYRKTRRQPTAEIPHTKVVPRNIHQEKEVLYFETIQLKQQNHKIHEQNTKLKTKIRVLEKQNQKLTRVIESQDDYPETKSRSRLTSNTTGNVDSFKIPAMKRLVREAREEVELLKSQNEKIKKSMKYTKIVELENENQILTDQMAKMTALIDELTAQKQEQQYFQKQAEELDGYLKIKLSENQQLLEKIRQLENQVYKMETSAKANLQKAMDREKRFQRDCDINKRRLEEAHKEIGALKADLSKQRQQKIASATTSMGVRNSQVSRNYRIPSSTIKKTVSSQNNDADAKKLQDEISSLKKKNQDLQKRNLNLSSTVKSHQSKLLISQRQKLSHSKNKSALNQKQSVSQQKIQFEKRNSSIESYGDDFEADAKQKTQERSKKEIDDDKYDILYDAAEDEDEEEILYQEEKPKSKQKKRDGSANKKSNTKKKALTELKQLITYRMIAQRYPFEELKQDIEETGEKSFKIAQLSSMLHNNPFFLNNKQVKIILKMLASDDHQNPQFQIPTIQVITTLHSLISDFELRLPKQDDQMYLKVAQMVTVYTSELEAAFEEKRNPNSMTISEKVLRELFKELELEKKYVDLIVAELSLVSEDLNHLDYVEFLNRFFIDKDEMGVEEVDEEQEQDNSKTLNKSKREDEDESEGSRFKFDKKKK